VAGVANAVKLSSNENPFGPSDKAKEAYLRAVHSLHRYPSTDHAELRAAIAEVHGLDAGPHHLRRGFGRDPHLCSGQAYAGPRDEVVFTEHGFLMYRICAGRRRDAGRGEGARAGDRCRRDPAACGPRTKLVFIANPNNPTGTMISPAEVERLADGLPRRRFWCWTAPMPNMSKGFDGGAALVAARSNVVMTRTFSKIYGLGGLRIGWGYGPQAIIDVLNRIRQPFNLSTARWTPPKPRCATRTGWSSAGPRTPACAAGWPARWPNWACRRTCRWPTSSWPVSPAPKRPRPATPSCRAGADRAPGGRLQAAALPAHHHRRRGLCRRVAHAVAQFKGVK
jgi:hypothetical protein